MHDFLAAHLANSGVTRVEAAQIPAEDPPTGVLSTADACELLRCEEDISRGWESFLAVGRALMKIRDRRLYRARFRSFEAYCRSRWGYGRSYSYRLISAAGVVDQLSDLDSDDLPLCEAQIRPLIGLAPERVRSVWQEALRRSKSGSLTADVIRTIARSQREPHSKPKRAVPRTSASNPISGSAALESAHGYLDLLEEAIRSGNVNHAELGYIYDLRRCLRTLGQQFWGEPQKSAASEQSP